MSETDNKRKSRSDEDEPNAPPQKRLNKGQQSAPPQERSNNDDEPVDTKNTSDLLLVELKKEFTILQNGLEALFQNQKKLFDNQSKIFKGISVHHNYGVNNIVKPLQEMSNSRPIDELNIKKINQLPKTEAVNRLTDMRNSQPNEFRSLLNMMQFIDQETNKPIGTIRPIDMHIKDSPRKN